MTSVGLRRASPAFGQTQIGWPVLFFDQTGPAEFITDQGIDVRPYLHIGLATVTYLYKGEFQHQDSLGTNQMIYPRGGEMGDRGLRRDPFRI